MNICSIRGATTAAENTRECIIKTTEELLKEVIEQNDIKKEDIINIFFTATKDITKAYPAIATRNLGITDCAIMCMQELDIEESLPMCIRTMLTVNTNKTKGDLNHVYLKEAKKLRPDISMKKNPISVAIDGPAGSGKSTVSKIIAKELSFKYIDTGAMFRAIAYHCLKTGIDCNDFEKVSKSIENLDITLKFDEGIQKVYLNNSDISDEIRNRQVSNLSSIIAKIPDVREKLLLIQRNMAKDQNVIMDGRDVGTNILPNANVKIYLDADVCERARRRGEEIALKGENIEQEKLIEEIKQRDEQDKNRKIAPLKMAEDAIYINTTEKTIYEVTEEIIKLIKQNIK